MALGEGGERFVRGVAVMGDVVREDAGAFGQEADRAHPCRLLGELLPVHVTLDAPGHAEGMIHRDDVDLPAGRGLRFEVRPGLGGKLAGVGGVEEAAAVPFDPAARDVMRATSRPLGELLASVEASHLYVGLGGTANMDGGAGLLDALAALPAPTTVLCDVRTRLADAARLFGPQKGATDEGVRELERRLESMDELRPYADLEGSGAAGGLGAALAALGADLVRGAPSVLDLVGFDDALTAHDLVVSGEGQIDATTLEGKAPGEVARRCSAAGNPSSSASA